MPALLLFSELRNFRNFSVNSVDFSVGFSFVVYGFVESIIRAGLALFRVPQFPEFFRDFVDFQ